MGRPMLRTCYHLWQLPSWCTPCVAGYMYLVTPMQQLSCHSSVAEDCPKCEKKLHLVKNHYNITLNELNKKRCYGSSKVDKQHSKWHTTTNSLRLCRVYLTYYWMATSTRTFNIWGMFSRSNVNEGNIYWVGGLRRNLLLVLLPKITIITRV